MTTAKRTGDSTLEIRWMMRALFVLGTFMSFILSDLYIDYKATSRQVIKNTETIREHERRINSLEVTKAERIHTHDYEDRQIFKPR